MDEPAAGTACRGIRGATTVDGDEAGGVLSATVELLDALIEANGCRLDDLAAVVFTVTEDLQGSNPAAAARGHGWGSVPLLVLREHGGDSAVERCLRVLVLWNTSRAQADIRHVYLRGARALRPDLAGLT
jgi:chorismate mutase